MTNVAAQVTLCTGAHKRFFLFHPFFRSFRKTAKSDYQLRHFTCTWPCIV